MVQIVNALTEESKSVKPVREAMPQTASIAEGQPAEVPSGVVW